MMYAVVRKYAVNGNDDTFDDWFFKPTSHDNIYNKMMEITGGDHEISSDAACWCELATEGETYEFREGEIEVQDFN